MTLRVETHELAREIQETTLPEDSIALWWLGQMSFACRLGRQVLYFDPYLSQDADRLVPPLLSPEEITGADMVLGSHDHLDHIDRQALPALLQASPQAVLLVPAPVQPSLARAPGFPPQRIVGMEEERSFRRGEVVVSAIAAAHEFLDRDEQSGLYPYLCYVVRWRGFTLLHAGDTVLYEGFHHKLRQLGKIDVMILPINGRDGKRYRSGTIGNMTFQEAADLAGTLRPNLVIPGHYDMFAHNSEDPALFADMVAAKYPGQPVHIATHGKRLLCQKEEGHLTLS